MNTNLDNYATYFRDCFANGVFVAVLMELLAGFQHYDSNVRRSCALVVLDLLPVLTRPECSRVLEAVTYALASEANTDAAAAQVEVIQTLRRLTREAQS